MVVLGILFYKRCAVQIALRYESSRVALYVATRRGWKGLSVKVGMGAVCEIAKVAYSGYWHNV